MESGTRSWIGRSCFWSLALAGAGSCACAWAQDEVIAQLDPSALPHRVEQPARLEVSATTLPRLDGLEASRPRLDMTLLPPRRSAVGLAVGMSGLFQQPAAAGAGLPPGTPAAMDVGVHWRHTLDSNQRVDITAWRRVAQQTDAMLAPHLEPTYGARVELNLGPQRRSGFVMDRSGFLGLQLQSGARISIKRKYGGPMIYYRSTF